jgi:hypothetical protein
VIIAAGRSSSSKTGFAGIATKPIRYGGNEQEQLLRSGIVRAAEKVSLSTGRFMTKSNAKTGVYVRDKDGVWMQIVGTEREMATCSYSDGHGILTVSRKISDLKEEKK